MNIIFLRTHRVFILFHISIQIFQIRLNLNKNKTNIIMSYNNPQSLTAGKSAIFPTTEHLQEITLSTYPVTLIYLILYQKEHLPKTHLFPVTQHVSDLLSVYQICLRHESVTSLLRFAGVRQRNYVTRLRR